MLLVQVANKIKLLKGLANKTKLFNELQTHNSKLTSAVNLGVSLTKIENF